MSSAEVPWDELWRALEGKGWKMELAQRGSGSNRTYYLPPRAARGPGFKARVDYFDSQNGVRKHLKDSGRGDLVRPGSQSPTTPQPEALAPAAPEPTAPKASVAAAFGPAVPMLAIPKPPTYTMVLCKPSVLEPKPSAPQPTALLSALSKVAVLPTAAAPKFEAPMIAVPKHSLRKKPWQQLWPELVSQGWKTEHGPGPRGQGTLQVYYLRPGVRTRSGFKLDADYFDSQCGVCKFLSDYRTSQDLATNASEPESIGAAVPKPATRKPAAPKAIALHSSVPEPVPSSVETLAAKAALPNPTAPKSTATQIQEPKTPMIRRPAQGTQHDDSEVKRRRIHSECCHGSDILVCSGNSHATTSQQQQCCFGSQPLGLGSSGGFKGADKIMTRFVSFSSSILEVLQNDLRHLAHDNLPYELEKDFAPGLVLLKIGPGQQGAVCAMKDEVDEQIAFYKKSRPTLPWFPDTSSMAKGINETHSESTGPRGMACAKMLARSHLRCQCHFSSIMKCPARR